MNLSDHGGTFADGRGDPLGRTRTHVSDREDAWAVGLKR